MNNISLPFQKVVHNFFLFFYVHQNDSDIPGFLDRLDKARDTAEAARKSLWDGRLPHSELIFPHVGMNNEEHLRKKFNRAILEQVLGKLVVGGYAAQFAIMPEKMVRKF